MSADIEQGQRKIEAGLKYLNSREEDGPYGMLRSLAKEPLIVTPKEYSDFLYYRREQLSLIVDATLPIHNIPATEVRKTILASAVREAALEASLISVPGAPQVDTTQRTIEERMDFGDIYKNALINPDNASPVAILFRSALSKASERIRQLQG